MNLTPEEISALKATTSEAEWNDVCASIKRARQNSYPPDWYTRIMLSGLLREIQQGWK